MINPYTDPRYELARMMRSQGQAKPIDSTSYTPPKAPSRAAVQLGRAANDLALGNPGMQERLRRIAEGRSNESPKGLVAGVLNNPVAKGAFNALNVVTIPGRAIVAGLDELNKATDMDPSTKASVSSFVKNVKDVQYGFGRAFNPNTGNIWLDRAIGFAGDVFLDPLTYATFGAGKFAGYAGRLDLANNVLKVTGDAGLAGRVARFGRTAPGMNSDILELAGANKFGLHFLGKRINVGKTGEGLRLPGSGSLGYLGEAGLSRLRVLTMDSKAGQMLRKVTMPGDFLNARQALASGTVSDSAAGALVSFFNADPIQRMEAGRVLQTQRQRLENLFKAEQANGLEGYKNSLVDLLENDDAFNRATPEMQRAASIYKGIFAEYEDGLLEALKTIDPTIDPSSRFRANYFPRMVSDAGLDVLSDPTHPFGSSLRTIFQRDPLNGGRNFRARLMEPDDVFFGQKLTSADLASTTKLNEIARRGGFKGDFFETDITKVMERYINEYAQEMGVMAKHKHLVDTGFWKRVQDIEVGGQFVDQELVDGLKKRVATLDEDLAKSAKSSAEAVRALDGAIAEARSGLKKQIKDAEGTLKNLESFDGLARTADQILNEGIDLTDAGLQQVIDQMGTFKKRFADLLGVKLTRGGKIIPGEGMLESDVPVVAESLLSMVANTEAAVALARENLEAARGGIVGKQLEEFAEGLKKEIETINKDIESARTRAQNVLQYGNILNENLERVIAGDISGLADEQLKDIGLLLSPASGANTVQDMIDNRLGIFGDAQTWLRSWMNKSDSSFVNLTRLADTVSKDDVAKMSKAELEDIMSRALDSKVDPDELRKAAFYMLGLDERAYGGMMPEALVSMRSNLENSLLELDEALAYSRSIQRKVARGERSTAKKIFESQVKDAYVRVVDAINELDSISRFQNEDIFVQLRNAVDENPAVRDVPDAVTFERMSPFFEKYPFLRDLFDRDPVDEVRELMNEDMFLYKPSEKTTFSERGTAKVSYSVGEFLDEIDNAVRMKNGILEQPAYEFGSGASRKSWTGMELKARVDEYNALKQELSDVRSYKSKVEEEFYTDSKVPQLREEINTLRSRGVKNSDPRIKEIERLIIKESRGPDLEEEIQKLLNNGVKETDPRIVSLNNRIETFRKQAKARAGLVEYDDALIIELRKAGYFNAETIDEAAAIRADIESYYVSSIKSRRGTQKGTVKTRSGTFSIGDRETEIRKKISDISGGDGFARPEAFDGLPNVQRRFAETALNYSVVSEVHSRFAALSASIAPFEIAPTERMVQGILNVVAQKHIPRVQTKINAHRQAQVILSRMDEQVSQSIRGGVKPSQAFADSLNSLSRSERELLQEAVGQQMNWTADPMDLRNRISQARKNKSTVSAGPVLDADGKPRVDKNGKLLKLPSDATVAENKVFEEFVEPWFRAAYPNERYSKDAAKTKIRQLTAGKSAKSKASLSPFADEATDTAVRRWFESILGSSDVPGRSLKTGGIPPIELEIRSLKGQESRLRSLLAPDLNIGLWLDDPSITQRTATWYSYLMDDLAERLDSAIDEHVKQIDSVNRGLSESADFARQAARIDEEIERITGAAERVATLRSELDLAKNNLKLAITEAGPNYKVKMKSDVLVRNKIKGLQDTVASLEKEITEINRLPKRFESLVARTEAKEAAYVAARKPVDDLMSLVESVDEKISVFTAKDSLTQAQKSSLKKLRDRRKSLTAQLKVAEEKASKVPALTRGELEVLRKFRKQNAIEQMSKYNQEYSEIVASAEYAKAVVDEEMHNALKFLSDYNLEDFSQGFRIADTFEEGARGLPDRIQRVVLMPDGQPLIFSRAESLALFRSQLSPEQIRASRNELVNSEQVLSRQLSQQQSVVANLETQIEAADNLINELNVSALDLERQLDAGRALEDVTPGQYGSRRSALSRRLQSVNQKISNIQGQLDDLRSQRSSVSSSIRDLENQIDDVRIEFESFDKTTQSSALLKVRILTQGTTVKATGEKIPAVLDSNGLKSWADGVNPIRASAPDNTVSTAESIRRRQHLNSAWNGSDSKTLVDRANRLRQNVYVSSLDSMRNDVNNSNLESLRMMSIVEKRAATADKLLDDVVNTRTAAIREARIAGELTEARTGEVVNADLFAGTADNPLAQGDPAFVTSENIRKFAESVRSQNAPTGPFVERITPAQAKAVNQNIKAVYDRKIANAERVLNEAIQGGKSKATITRARNAVKKLKEERSTALASGRSEAQLEYGIRQREAKLGRRVEQYNAAKQSVEDWKKKNPSVIRDAEKALKEQQQMLADVNKIVKKLTDIDEKTVAKLDKLFGGTDGYWKQVNDTRALLQSLNEQLTKVELITAMPDKEAKKLIMRVTAPKGGGVSNERLVGALNSYREWLDENRAVFETLAQNPDDPIAKAWAAVADAEADYILNSQINLGAINALNEASVGTWATRVVTPLAKEWKKAAKESGLYDNMVAGGKRAVDEETGRDISKGFPGLMGNEEALNLLNRMEMLNTPGVVNDLAKFMRGYTGFFRSYATLSPGFHVRNTISNTFALFSAGADVENLTRGFAAWKQVQYGLKNGRSIDSVVDAMPEDQREFARIAYKVMVGLGGGRTADALEGFVRQGNKITQNRLLDISRNTGNTLEGASRFMLAYDSAVKGMDEVTAFNRTGRFLVDYQKKTVLDESMRNIMPFWVWMSRNLPLQIVTRWTNPKPYLVFDKFSKNFNATEEGEVVPEYLRNMGAIGLGGGNFLSLDLPFSRVDEQIQQFGDPKQLFSYLNPGIKTPIEFLTNTDTFRNRKFADTYRKVDGLMTPFLPLLQALGQVEYDSNGNPVTTERAYSALTNLIPVLGRGERLMPSDGSFSGQAVRGFFGVPYTQVSEGAENAELYRRLQEVQRVAGVREKADEAR